MIKRYVADADTTITNAYKDGFISSGSLSNMGESDSLEVFYIKGQASSGSMEKSRALLKFPVDSIVADRAAGHIPASGSVSFYMRLHNAKHPFTLPRNYTLTVAPVSASWEEGMGVDSDNYTDLGAANWMSSSVGTEWTTEGGDYHLTSRFDVEFDRGYEDLEVDISSLVEEWVDGTKENYGVGVFLSGAFESGNQSYYTKKFFARGSEYFHLRPVIEARWDSSVKDNRGNFYASSSLMTGQENLMTLYLYNYVRGQLRNIPSIGTGSIYVTLSTAATGGDEITPSPDSPVTGGYVSTGIYSASFALNTTSSIVYDKWFSESLSTCFHTGSVRVRSLEASNFNPESIYYTKVTNLKSWYSPDEVARFRVFTRERGYASHLYTRATQEIEPTIVEDAYYRLFRSADEYEVVSYGTGSLNHTRMSYDVSGSYFDVDMNLLQPGYAYSLQFVYLVNGNYQEQEELFKFKVRDE